MSDCWSRLRRWSRRRRAVRSASSPAVPLARPASALACLVLALPEPTRGGRNPLISATARPVAAAAGADGEQQATDAQRLANELGIEPDPELVLRRDPRRLGLLAAA